MNSMLLTLPNILLIAGILLITVHFYFFNKTIKILSQEELDKFIKEAGSKLDMLITIILFWGLFYFDSYEVKILFSALIILSIIVSTIRHHKKLRSLEFDEAFEKRLLNISFISVAGIILILSSFIIDAYAT